MRVEQNFGSSDGAKVASQVYWNARKKLNDICLLIFEDSPPILSNNAKNEYENIVAFIKSILQKNQEKKQEFYEMVDIESAEDIDESFIHAADIDDLSPNLVKQTMLNECILRGKCKVDLRLFLRSVLDSLYKDKNTRRPNVGANRHWPRLLQYLRELEEQTDWSPNGNGIRLVSKGGHGPVAKNPKNPSSLNISIDPEYLV